MLNHYYQTEKYLHLSFVRVRKNTFLEFITLTEAFLYKKSYRQKPRSQRQNKDKKLFTMGNLKVKAFSLLKISYNHIFYFTLMAMIFPSILYITSII